VHRRTGPGRCGGGRWGGTHHRRGGASELERELESASGGALRTIGSEKGGGRLGRLLDGGGVARPRDGACEVTHNFTGIQGSWRISCKSEEQRDGCRGWELLHPQRTIVAWRRVGLGLRHSSSWRVRYGAEKWRWIAGRHILLSDGGCFR